MQFLTWKFPFGKDKNLAKQVKNSTEIAMSRSVQSWKYLFDKFMAARKSWKTRKTKAIKECSILDDKKELVPIVCRGGGEWEVQRESDDEEGTKKRQIESNISIITPHYHRSTFCAANSLLFTIFFYLSDSLFCRWFRLFYSIFGLVAVCTTDLVGPKNLRREKIGSHSWFLASVFGLFGHS